MADESEEEQDPKPSRSRKGGGGRKGQGARASISVEGDVPDETVDRVLGAAGAKEGGGKGTATAARPPKFPQAIRNPQYRIIAKRISPQTTADGQPLQDEYEIFSHDTLSVDEIKRDISTNRGGNKWHVRVLNSDDEIVSAQTILCGGEPTLDPSLAALDGGGGRGGPMGGHPGGGGAFPGMGFDEEEETVEQQIAKDPDVVAARKRLELLKIEEAKEEREANLAEARTRRLAAERAAKGDDTNGHARPDRNGGDKDDLKAAIEAAVAPLRAENERLRKRDEDRDKDSAYQRMIEQQTAPLRESLKEQQRALEKLLDKANQPPPPQGRPMEDVLREIRRDWERDTEKQISSAITGVTGKLDALAQTVTLLAQGKGNDPATNALVTLATQAGKGGPGTPDPFLQMMKAMEVMKNLQTMTNPPGTGSEVVPPDFPSYVVSKMSELAPQVFEFIEKRQGAAPSKEEIENMMRQQGMKMYEGLDQTIKKEIATAYAKRTQQQAGQQQPQQQAAVQQPAAPPPGVPQAAPPQPGVQPPAPQQATVQPQQPGPAPAAVAPPPGVQPGGQQPVSPPGAPPQQVQPQPQQQGAPPAQPGTPIPPQTLAASLSAQDYTEYKKRVDMALRGMHREMQLGVRAMKWPEFVYNNFPKPLVDQIIMCDTDEGLYEIVKPYGDPDVLKLIWAYLSTENQQHEWYRGWLADGLNWIKEASGAIVEEEETDPEPPGVNDA